MFKVTLSVLISILPLVAQSPDPAYATLEKAYAASRDRQFDQAILLFQQAIAIAPDRPAPHKDLAYLYLKTGETVAARDQFQIAIRLAPADTHIALEYAFLCYETKQQSEARRTFDRLRKQLTGAEQATAEQAFQNIDKPLADGIHRWQQALASSPGNYSAHIELANLAEQRDELALAAEHYERAWRLKPGDQMLLVSLGRVLAMMADSEHAARSRAVILAAVYSSDARTSETAKELLPQRTPYASEYRDALAFAPANIELRRELAYLLIAVNQKPQAEKEFEKILELAPKDLIAMAQLGLLRLARNDQPGAMPLLKAVMEGENTELANRVRSALSIPPLLRRAPEAIVETASASGPSTKTDSKTLGLRSLDAGYLQDALKYLQAAHENDPLDFEVMLKIGWTYNILHQDDEAIKWFALARKSPDKKLSEEAKRAHQNLEAEQSRIRVTTWAMPLYSTRWKDLFAYGQTKVDWRLGKLPFRPYLSVRFVGDTRGAIGATNPQYLSESSFIAGVGVASRPWFGITAWGEAGEAINYNPHPGDKARMLPDYRAGTSYGKGFGPVLGSNRKGIFVETHEDAVYLSRFQNDTLFYTQTKGGYTLPPFENIGIQGQLYWNGNATLDVKRQAWANVFETGPGIRFRIPMIPKPMILSADILRGWYLRPPIAPQKPVFNDIRIGLWYAFTH